MADTTYQSTEVRKYIWSVLEEKYGQGFSRRQLGVRTGGIKSFDCVSDDGSIVAELKTSTGRSSSGRIKTGAIFSTDSNLYYLSLLDVRTRLLIFTDREFCEIYTKKMQGFLIPGVEIVLMELPDDMQQKIDEITDVASKEVGG